ncbi:MULTISPECIES: YkgJ family cysteine cluster protein [unclassified Helicobacter]|uniref:YkgJ family cysteine cluster protein n=1 Tax=unclassified Helicobacter TaxID=2593540 RepID=UPI000CF0D7E9|nr:MULTISPECIES: YkgJ family cysteine cluster protein [unclassified Helicobacter]
MDCLGFNFSFEPNACEACGGKCCTGESGYIFCSISEMEQISAFLNLSFDEFTQKYVKRVGYKFSLIEKPYFDGYACVFFDEKTKRCKIYEVRPKQCRTFPFWDSFKDQKGEDYKMLLKMCLGIRLDKDS